MFDVSKINNPRFFADNRLPAHSDHIAFADMEELVSSIDCGWETINKNNSYRYPLDGLWKFHYARNLSQSIEGFYEEAYDAKAWEDIRVPAHIQMEGYDAPQYANVQYPWDGRENVWNTAAPSEFNPVASYVKYFYVPEDMKGKRIFISLQGVESGFALWLNGQYIGYSEDTFDPSDFELTRYIKDGENKLAIQVYKWTSSSWCEDQDFFRFSGIFRSVFLYAMPKAHVYDLKVEHTLSDDLCEASLSIECAVIADNDAKDYSIRARLIDVDMHPLLKAKPSQRLYYESIKYKGFDNSCANKAEIKHIFEETVRLSDADIYDKKNIKNKKQEITERLLYKGEYNDSCYAPLTDKDSALIPLEITKTVINPKLWSAEEPNLYDLWIEILDGENRTVEVICQKIGFRRFELKDGLMLLNNKRIVFKGVNRHEFSARGGRVPDMDDLLLDIITMKKNNINAIRTSHYPNDSLLYALADKYGLYLIAENNMESHGSWDAYIRHKKPLADVVPKENPDFKDMLLDRVNSCYQRDKNHTSILIWSCGNESFGGSIIYEMSEFFRRLDGKRLVHYEGVFNDRSYNDTSDMESQMYPSAKSIKEFLDKHTDKPFICCEYTHAMGNSCGGMHKYTDLTDTEPRYQGGFIWDYIDQSIYKKDRYGKEFLAYGGDFLERPCDYNFSGNGIVYGGGRKASPKLQEVKYNYQNISVEFADDSFKVINKNLFIPTSVYDCVAVLQKNGVIVDEAALDIDVAPLESREYPVPFAHILNGEKDKHNDKNEYALLISFRLKQDTLYAARGHEVSFGQKVYRPVNHDNHTIYAPLSGAYKPFRVTKGVVNVGVKGDNFEVLFSYLYGGLVSYRYGGKEMIEKVPMPNFWRAPVDNDMGSMAQARYAQWKIASMYVSHKTGGLFEDVPVETKELEDCFSITYTYYMPTTPKSSCKVNYRVYGDGTVVTTLSYDVVKELGDMPEFGMIFKFNADYENLEWYGLGYEETYADRKLGAKLGIYKNKVSDNLAAYLVPQECGNKEEVRWAKLTDNKGRGMMFAADSMSFNALAFTPHELENAMHEYELPQVHYTVVRAALAQMGVGGDDSWGARVHDEYLIKADDRLEFTFAFKGI